MTRTVPQLIDFLDKKTAREITPLSLAFVGDGVQTLYVRVKYLLNSGAKAGALHTKTANEIKAVMQAKEADILLPLFNDEESDIFHRARNSRGGTPSKNASTHDYKKASGYEAVIGYLYLTGQTERLEYLFKQTEKLFEE